MFPKSTAAFASISLAVHALFAASLVVSYFTNEREDPAAVEIQYIASQPSSLPPSPLLDKKPSQLTTEKIAEPVKQVQAPAVRSVAAPKLAPGTSKRSTPPKPPLAIQKSEDLLADPAKGKIFTAYFAKIKERVQETVQRKYWYQNIGGGSVALFFMLDSGGNMESASALEKQSTGSREVREFAVRCLRESAPFGAFPRDLHLDKISFNLTVLFEEI